MASLWLKAGSIIMYAQSFGIGDLLFMNVRYAIAGHTTPITHCRFVLVIFADVSVLASDCQVQQGKRVGNEFAEMIEHRNLKTKCCMLL